MKGGEKLMATKTETPKTSIEDSAAGVTLKAPTESEMNLVTRLKRGRRADVARPIIEEFMSGELDIVRVVLDETEIGGKGLSLKEATQSMLSTLRHFVNANSMPIKVSKRRDLLFMVKVPDNGAEDKPLSE